MYDMTRSSSHSENRVNHQLIMCIEDSDADYEALLRALKKIGAKLSVIRFIYGHEVENHLLYKEANKSAGIDSKRPDLILLDLNLPGAGGLNLLKFLKKNDSIRHIPVIILSSSANPNDVELCYAFGANAYLLKPLNPKDLEAKMLAFTQFWLTHAILPRGTKQIINASDRKKGELDEK